jgi:peptidoglycan/LPS O-acetylase OafA/YrhL
MRSFSFIENFKRLSKPRAKHGDQELEVLNGVRFWCSVFVILGQTYLYTLTGPIQNLEAIQNWVESSFFSLVLTADLVVDTFFWLSAFLASYQLLVSMKLNGGRLPQSKCMLVLTRAVRLLPLYAFTLLFYWRFIVLFGGEGPMFFQYENLHTCSDNWFWHLTFLNNLVPWDTRDNCMSWTWYIACEMQFYLVVPLLVSWYFHNR